MEDRYHYTECGLDNVYLLNGFHYRDTPRGCVVTIEDVDGLHCAIGRFLVHEKKKLTGKEFRFLRHELSLSQASLAFLLGVDEQSVARWEKDQTKSVSPAAERMTKALYEQHVGGRPVLSELLHNLADLEEVADEDLSFEDTDDGWQPAKAA